jgi:hypothetical protein
MLSLGIEVDVRGGIAAFSIIHSLGPASPMSWLR